MHYRYFLILLVVSVAATLFLFLSRERGYQENLEKASGSKVVNEKITKDNTASQKNIQGASSYEARSPDKNVNEDSSAGIEQERESRPLSLNLRLAGTVVGRGKESHAVIVDEETGTSHNYGVGDFIKKAKVLQIHNDHIVLEKDGMTQRLSFAKDSSVNISLHATTQGSEPPVMGGPVEELEPFEPVVSKTGPLVDEGTPVEDLSPFEPITSDTGPPVDPTVEQKDFIPFEPVESESGPPE
jgi:type II secretory pathway component PulC